MNKTYKLLENTTVMTADDIKREYRGYWVFLTNISCSDEGKFLSGIPVVIGDMAYDGAEDGIYTQFEDPKYGSCRDMSLLQLHGNITSLGMGC